MRKAHYTIMYYGIRIGDALMGSSVITLMVHFIDLELISAILHAAGWLNLHAMRQYMRRYYGLYFVLINVNLQINLSMTKWCSRIFAKA